jgi:hypothetical protein
MPAQNTDGFVNCLPQPGQLCNRLPKSMRENLYPLIKFCGTRTDPITKTKSIGLRADAEPALSISEGVPCFLLAIWTILS